MLTGCRRYSRRSAILAISACLACDPAGRQDARDSDDAPSSNSPEQELQAVHVLECEGLEYSLVDAELSRAGFVSRFGAPDSVQAFTEPNRHVEGVVDSLFIVFYPGLVLDIRKPEGAADLVAGVSLTDNRYVTDPRIGIGRPADSITEALGRPWEITGETLVYNCGVGADQPVTFHFRDGRVTRISIEYYVD